MSSGAGNPIENRVHQTAGLEIGVHLRQFLFQASADQVHVLKAAQPVAVVQTHLDKRRVRPRVRRVNRGKTRCDPDVGDDDLQVLCRHHFPYHLLHLLNQFVRQFQPQAGRRLEIDDKLAGVGARKVGFADQRIKSEAQDETR